MKVYTDMEGNDVWLKGVDGSSMEKQLTTESTRTKILPDFINWLHYSKNDLKLD